jgi:PadR family transcriptional regulator PadR
MDDASIPSDWLRGVLGLAVLRVVDAGPTYGYAIAQSLAEHGFGIIKGGTLYPLLGRFEEAGHVETEWRHGDGGPGRKYYRITESGRAALGAEGARWADFARRVTAFVTTPEGIST